MESKPFDEPSSLPNRFFFNELLNKTISLAKRQKKKFALLFIDVNNANQITASYGIELSQLALRELGLRLKSILRAEDTLARLEKDEFALLITDIAHSQELNTIIDKILELSSHHIKLASQEIKLNLSIGICMFPEDGETLQDLQKSADLALHRAKQKRGDSYEFHAPKMKLEAEDYVKLKNEMRQALTNKEFVLHFQPKFDLKEKVITSLEALIRWNHPQHGLMKPSQFINLAEENDLIIPLGEWILREACQTGKQWQKDGYKPISISVNLSPKQFHHPKITEIIEKVLKETELDPRHLDIEITEMTVMDDVSRINQFLTQLRSKGITISIDDFGTGHTSLSYLKDFPIDTLKIDQSYISSLPHDKRNAALVTDIISLAHHLGIKVVAEGVETLEQLEFLNKHHCDLVQGYFISRPLPALKMAALLNKE